MPVLINHYQRRYFVTPDDVLRLTIDTTLHAYDQRATTQPNLKRPLPQAQCVIVELKSPIDAVRRLSAALTHFPASVDRFSKYVQGVLAAPEFA